MTGCATFGDTKYVSVKEPLPNVPASIRACIKGDVATLPKGDWTKADVVRVVGAIRKSELTKTDCGRQLLAFYDDVASGRK